MPSTIDQQLASSIINSLGQSGTPHEFGVGLFTVGLDPFLKILEKEYFSTYLAKGGSAFKLVKGIYGGGKTHFLYCVRDLAWKNDYVVSYVSLKTGESAFYELHKVFTAVTRYIWPPLEIGDYARLETPGIETLLRTWYATRRAEYVAQKMAPDTISVALQEDIHQVKHCTSTSFKNSIVRALDALHAGDDDLFEKICAWIKGESIPDAQLKKLGITEKIDKSTAFKMFKSLGQAVRQLGYRGLIVLFDEGEQVASLSTKNRETVLSNLRELIDECANTTFAGVMVFYAIPDDSFLQGRSGVYQALLDRVQSVFQERNFRGVRIDLDNLNGLTQEDRMRFMKAMGLRVTEIYEAASGVAFDSDVDDVIEATAESINPFDSDGYKRAFAKLLVQRLGELEADMNEGAQM